MYEIFFQKCFNKKMADYSLVGKSNAGIYIYIYTHTHTYIYIYIYMFVYIPAKIYVEMYQFTWIVMTSFDSF